MRKSRSVIILLSIQLIIALSLALINPVSDYVIRRKGTEYTFAVEEAWLTGDFVSYVEANCYIEFRFGYDRFEYHPENYAIIETDKNGISYISKLSGIPPENGDWLGTEEKPFDWFCCYSSDKLDYGPFKNAFKNIDLFEDFNFSDNYEITVKVSVYKGKAVLNTFLVDGIKIEEFLTTLKEAQK